MESGSIILHILGLFMRDLQEEARRDVYFMRTTNYVGLMGYTILLWDHFISFEDEVQYIWLRPKSPAAYLFFLNRYFTPIAFIGNLVAYFAEWTPESCERFVRYEGSCTIIALEVAAIMMFLRVWALYKYQKLILASVIALLLVETGVFAWLMTRSQEVPHSFRIVKSCTMIFDPGLGGWPSLSAWLPLIYDSYATVLTLYKCMPPLREKSPVYYFRILLRDGLVYYGVIFLVNFILAIMIVAAPPAIKNIAAQLEQLLTVAMISRITISLRREAYQRSPGLVTSDDHSYKYELDGWAVKRRDRQLARTQRSSTICQHISVIPRSDIGHDSPYVLSPIGSIDNDPNKTVRCSHVENGVDSIGVLSISPAHTREASEVAAGVASAAPPAAVITDASMMNDQSAYELRVMRPALNPTTNHLRI